MLLKTAQTLAIVVQPGVTTDEIDRAVHKMIIDNGAYPSPLRYGAHLVAILKLQPSCCEQLLPGCDTDPQSLACSQQLLQQAR
jgi:hypothetical protein